MATAKRPIDALIFDLDGTLVDSLADLTAAVNHVRTLRGRGTVSESVVRGFVGDGLDILLSRALATQDRAILRASADDFRAFYEPHCLDRTRLYDGVLEVLDQYAGKKLAVVSNKPVVFTKKILKGLDVASRFGAILGPESVSRQKPDPESFILVARAFGVAPNRICAVGDRATDVEAGRGAGMMTAGVTYGIGDPNDVLRASPDVILADIRELENFIR